MDYSRNRDSRPSIAGEFPGSDGGRSQTAGGEDGARLRMGRQHSGKKKYD